MYPAHPEERTLSIRHLGCLFDSRRLGRDSECPFVGTDRIVPDLLMGGLLGMNMRGFEGARALLCLEKGSVLRADLGEHHCTKLAYCSSLNAERLRE